MWIKGILGVLAIGGSIFTACGNQPTPKECCTGKDQLNVIMDGRYDDWDEICQDMGGKPLRLPTIKQVVCEDIDF